jgi:hypothetical protein
MLDTFQGAVDELTWRFQRGDSALGIRGQSYDDVKSGGVWDEAASERAHWSRRDEAYRHAVQKVMRVDATLAELTAEHRRLLRLACEPYGRSSSRLQLAFTQHRLSLLGVAMETHVARVTFARAHDTVIVPSATMLLRWLESEATRASSAALFDRLRRAAWEQLTPAFTAYEERRQERMKVSKLEHAEGRARREAELERVLDEQHERERLKLEERHMRALAELAAQRHNVPPANEVG